MLNRLTMKLCTALLLWPALTLAQLDGLSIVKFNNLVQALDAFSIPPFSTVFSPHDTAWDSLIGTGTFLTLTNLQQDSAWEQHALYLVGHHVVKEHILAEDFRLSSHLFFNLKFSRMETGLISHSLCSMHMHSSKWKFCADWLATQSLRFCIPNWYIWKTCGASSKLSKRTSWKSTNSYVS
jgi:hypothetical protein